MRNALITRATCRPALSPFGFDRFFDGFFDGLGDLLPRESETAPWSPAIDIEETGDAWTVRADLPGIPPEDIKISVHDGRLILKGERKRSEERKEGGVRWTERCQGSFSRTIALPSEVNAEEVTAKYNHGVLEVHCPLKPESRPRGIEVSVN
ncbi:MAG TPA: Hsp20/alpha crystallin family protein [Sumerlaeia bacterium]|nr:Hsp20/alpha crystallin family protein [Sumerlaeia bacterium]